MSKLTNLPNLSSPVDTTILLATDFQTATNSVKLTVANLRSYVVAPTLTYATAAFGRTNSAFIVANTASNTANAGFIQANSSYNLVNSVYDFANTINAGLSNTNIKLNSSYDYSNSVYVYAQAVHNVANASFAFAANSFIQANSSYNKANLGFDLATTANNKAEQAISISSSATQYSQEANVTATIALSSASDALSIAQSSDITAQLAFNSSNSAISLSTNTAIKLESAFALSNTNNEGLLEVQQKITNELQINVLDFGAFGDGLENDTISIQNAINSSNGVPVHIPAGVYLCDTITLNPGTLIKGDGSNATVILANTSNTVIFNYQTDVTEEKDFGIQGITMISGGSANCIGINISGTNSLIPCNKIKILDVNCSGFDKGIVLNYCKNYFISGGYFSDNINDIFLRQSKKGQIYSNICESGSNNYNIFEATGSNNNIIMGNILTKTSYLVGSGSIKVNNLENID